MAIYCYAITGQTQKGCLLITELSDMHIHVHVHVLMSCRKFELIPIKFGFFYKFLNYMYRASMCVNCTTLQD